MLTLLPMATVVAEEQEPKRSVCYDMSVDGMLAEHVPKVKRAPGYYHLWALHDGKNVTKSVHWDAVMAAVKRGDELVWTDIESDTSPNADWRRPQNTLAELNPDGPPTLAEVKETHRLIGARLAPVIAAAKLSGSPVWDYRTVQINSLELWVSEPAKCEAELDRLVALDAVGNQSLAEMLHASGGGVIFEVYVPDAWNVENFWLQVKAVIALERQAAAYRRLGLRAMPLLNPDTVDGAPVRPELLNALIQSARSRGDWGWWAQDGATSEALAREVGASIQ